LNNMSIKSGLPKQQHDVSTKQAMKCVHVTTVAVEKQYVLHILSVCVCVALVNQHAMRIGHFILSYDLSSSTLFSTLFHKRNDFLEKVLSQKCVF